MLVRYLNLDAIQGAGTGEGGRRKEEQKTKRLLNFKNMSRARKAGIEEGKG